MGVLQAFPPMRKEGRDRVRQLAALYGMKSSEQCGRGEKRFVMVGLPCLHVVPCLCFRGMEHNPVSVQ